MNVALPAGTSDAGWLRAFHAVVPEVLRAFQPQMLVTQHGCDSHRHDPLADLDLTVDGQRASYLALAALADELCEGRWVSTGGGGYAVHHVVPRAWTHLLGIVGGEPVPPETPTPAAWRADIGDRRPDHDDRRRATSASSRSRTGSPRRAGWTRPSSPPGGRCSPSWGSIPSTDRCRASVRRQRQQPDDCRRSRCTNSIVCHYSHTSTRGRRRGSRRDEYRNGWHIMAEESASAQAAPAGVTPLGANLPGGSSCTVAEVAAILRVSKMSVYRLIHSGQLEAVQFGRSFRVSREGPGRLPGQGLLRRRLDPALRAPGTRP